MLLNFNSDKGSPSLDLIVRYIESLTSLIQHIDEKTDELISSGYYPVGYTYLSDILIAHLLDVYGGDPSIIQSYKNHINKSTRIIVDKLGETFKSLNQVSGKGSPSVPIIPHPSTLQELELKLKQLKPEDLKQLLSHFYDTIIDLYLDKKKKQNEDTNPQTN